jgi:hypothetical protein
MFLRCFRTAILRHRAADFKLQVRRDGYVAVAEILKLSMKTMAGKPLNSHTEDDVRQVPKVFLKQRHLLRFVQYFWLENFVEEVKQMSIELDLWHALA